MDVFGEIRGPSANGAGDGRPRFPDLPILNAGDVPAPVVATPMGERQKYGGLFYLGIAGLVVLVGLIGWFGYGLWVNRDIWADVYILNDPERASDARLEAAERLSRNSRLDDESKLEMALRKDLPGPARYVLAEAVSTDAVAHAPRAFALMVARSGGWPDWLRVLLVRRLAYGAGRGYDIPREALEKLKRRPDPMISLWATYALAVLPRDGLDPPRMAELEQAAGAMGPTGELASMLLAAARSGREEREHQLDLATAWLRRHHPQGSEFWAPRSRYNDTRRPDRGISTRSEVAHGTVEVAGAQAEARQREGSS